MFIRLGKDVTINLDNVTHIERNTKRNTVTIYLGSTKLCYNDYGQGQDSLYEVICKLLEKNKLAIDD